jgi:hypothetical protein
MPYCYEIQYGGGTVRNKKMNCNGKAKKGHT